MDRVPVLYSIYGGVFGDVRDGTSQCLPKPALLHPVGFKDSVDIPGNKWMKNQRASKHF
jgi:hypothetical protein